MVAAGATAAILALGVLGVGLAPASAPPPPTNDNYIDSLNLNGGTNQKLNRKDTLEAFANTTSATVQTDIFNPPSSGGPPESTTCHGVSYGNTVWYDFHPDRNGLARIRTSGYDNVITLYSFSTKTLLPKALQCVHQSSSPFEELDAKVKRGVAYTIQIGGVSNVGGELQLLFDYFAPPHRLTAQSNLKALATSSGIKVLGLSVSSSRSAHVAVSCGRFCRSQTKFRHATESFHNLNGVQMPAGSELQIRVTAPQSIGAYIQYNILRGNFTKLIRCLEPGSRKPRRTCH